MEYSNEELELMNSSVEKLSKFLIEFNIDPSIRLINTFSYVCKQSLIEARNYITNRIKLVGGNSDLASQKVRSKEFEDLYQRFRMFRLSGKKINKRLKVYFGSPGTGKTTEAMKEAKGKCIVCNSSMLPVDLMEDFKLADGKGNLTSSSLRYVMENGEKIVLDEIGTLSVDCLRFLQGLTDGKEYFDYKGETIKIKEGFQILGTMNLYVNSTIYPLTDALVDRCTFDGLKEFRLPTKKLVEYAFE